MNVLPSDADVVDRVSIFSDHHNGFPDTVTGILRSHTGKQERERIREGGTVMDTEFGMIRFLKGGYELRGVSSLQELEKAEIVSSLQALERMQPC